MLAHLHQLVHGLDDAEQHKGHNQEVDDRRDKGTVLENQLAIAENIPHHGVKVDLAQDAQNGADEVIGQGCDQRGECAADDDTDGHIHHVAL